jgi:anti-sigma factor RsiW
MTARDHTSYREEVGAYLLGALTDVERQAFEQHLATCAECRAEVDRLRPAADVLPRSVEQVEPPPGLKASLMKVVEGEARERSGAPPRSLRERLLPRGGLFRPALAAGAALAVGLLAGIGIAQLGGDDERTVAAMVTGAEAQGARAELQIDDGDGTLTTSGLREPPAGGVYKVWVLRRGERAPRPDAVFLPDRSGGADVPVQGKLEAGDQVMVTPERDAQVTAPEGRPFISVSVPA